ncbi:hypothetical protein G3O08_11225 [Cryomorpha ignava]|uniref:Uncharacterized protein n=1 Tax=Cryomorpha ignava TaxID=101383 RepID=A0A7K3WSN1_9FLAO|nr:hypothetical protein [Cryomorpha ignava]NEN24071.1 hypothetical protein [Cryomorpha ignava]
MIGVSAIATSLIAIAFIILGIFMSGYVADISGKYFFIAGSVLVFVSVFFTIGLFSLKNQKPKGRIWVILASIGLIVILGLSAIQILTASPGWKLTFLTIFVSVLAIAPFVGLITYLWRFQNSKKPS